MSKQPASGMLLALLLTTIAITVLFVQPIKASGTIYILQNGSVNPPSAPIQRNGDVYVIVDDIEDSIVVQRDSIILDGTGHFLYGSGQGAGIGLYSVDNVTVVNLKINGFNIGVDIGSSTYIAVVECIITNNVDHGVLLSGSSHSDIVGNIIELNQGDGVHVELYSTFNEMVANSIMNNSMAGVNLQYSTHNTVMDNSISGNSVGINDGGSHNSTVVGNLVEGHISGGIRLQYTQDSLLAGNTVVGNGWNGIFLGNSSGNTIFHNNLLENFNQVYIVSSTSNWDNGYPSGGNYWSDEAGDDLYHGPFQNETGFDGICDYPYYYNDNPLDYYPLMGPFGPSTPVGDNVTVFPLDTLGLVFGNIAEEGETFAFRPDVGYAPPPGYVMLQRYDIETTATISGDILLRIIYDNTNMSPLQPENPTLFLINGLTGDVDYDFDVDIFDIVHIAGAYGTNFEDPNFKPECDLDRDGDIDIFDVVRAARNYGESISEGERYLDITTRVEPDFHVICGVVPHLSIFGVTRGI